ncbi:MAG: hypothetical protein Q9179_006733 [Wetmoreana sp. 5 TL-2023]
MEPVLTYGDKRWHMAQERRSISLGGRRGELCHISADEPEWIQQADASGCNESLGPRYYHGLSVPGFCTQADARAIAHSRPSSPRDVIQPPSSGTASAPNLSLGHGIEEEDTDLLSTASGEDEGQISGELALKTSVDRRAEKRKMKRFRSVVSVQSSKHVAYPAQVNA